MNARMNLKMMMLTIVISIFFFALSFGQSPNSNARRMPASAEQQFKLMDLDKDGKISLKEHSAGAKRVFSAMDMNKDGKVTAAEMDVAESDAKSETQEYIGPPRKLSATEKIRSVDSDQDGMLSAKEHTAGMTSMFTRTDLDRDGFLTAEEIREAQAPYRVGRKE